MIWILVLLLLVGLAGGYWVTHSQGMDQFWQLAGVGVFMTLLLIGIGVFARTVSSQGARRR